MYVQCQSSDKEFSILGSCTGYTQAYASDDEAKKAFFDSLEKETDFYADEKHTCKIKILSVKRAGAKGSVYLEFTAIGEFWGTPNVPIKGIVAFQSSRPFKIGEKAKLRIVKKN